MFGATPVDQYSGPVGPRDKDLVCLLETIRERLELSKGIWSEYLHIAPEQYEKVLDNVEGLSAVSLYHLSERLCLNPASFESGRIDFDALLEAERGNKHYLSPRYTAVAAYSRTHTAINALDFVTKHKGTYLRHRINRHFQVHDDFWKTADLDGAINIRFLTELWAYLKQNHFTNDEFQAIGLHSSTTLRGSRIARDLSASGTIESAYERMLGDFLERFERNCSYRIERLSSEECILQSRSITEVADALEVRHIGSEVGCQVRIGVFCAIPAYLGFPPAIGFETHCVHRGDSYCRFVLRYSRDRGLTLLPS